MRQTAVETERVFDARRRILVIGGVIPVVISVVTALIALTWLPELPDPVAIHWGPSGVDGFGPAAVMIIMPAAITIAFAVFAVISSWKVSPQGLLLSGQKLMVVTSLWLSVLLSVTMGGSLYIQRGLADASDSPDVLPWMLAGLAVGVLLSVGAWFALPAMTRVPLPSAVAAPIDVTETERVAWSRTVSIAPAAWWVIGVGLAVSLIAVVATVLTNTAAWIAAIVFVFISLFVVVSVAWRVTADRRGLIVRSAAGWPRVTVPVSDIASVQAVQVNPVAEFGGWGWRWDAAGRSGVIMRAGDAIEVTRSNGKRFVVTVPDAATAASVLSAHIR